MIIKYCALNCGDVLARIGPTSIKLKGGVFTAIKVLKTLYPNHQLEEVDKMSLDFPEHSFAKIEIEIYE